LWLHNQAERGLQGIRQSKDKVMAIYERPSKGKNLIWINKHLIAEGIPPSSAASGDPQPPDTC